VEVRGAALPAPHPRQRRSGNQTRGRTSREPDAAGDRAETTERDPRSQTELRPERPLDQAADDARADAGRRHGPHVCGDALEVGSIAMGRWKYFFGASILAVALLIKAGAPIVPLAVGLGVAAFITWKKSRPANRLPR